MSSRPAPVIGVAGCYRPGGRRFRLTEVHVAPIGEDGGCHVDQMGAVTREKALHSHDLADLHRVLSPAGAIQRVWRASLDRPLRGLASRILHVHVEVDVRVHPLDPHDRSGEGDRLTAIVLRRERMMSPGGSIDHQGGRDQDNTHDDALHVAPPGSVPLVPPANRATSRDSLIPSSAPVRIQTLDGEIPSKPPWPSTTFARTFATPSAACCARPAFSAGDDPDAGARHRRQHGDFLDRERRHPAAARLSQARTADVSDDAVSRRSASISSGCRRRSISSSARSTSRFRRSARSRPARSTSPPAIVRCASARRRWTMVCSRRWACSRPQGRLFRKGETDLTGPPPAPGSPPMPLPPFVILSHELWQTAFGGQNIVGQTVEVNGLPREVIGIMPPGADVMDNRTEIWTAARAQSRRIGRTAAATFSI